jgi:hypothetical protein
LHMINLGGGLVGLDQFFSLCFARVFRGRGGVTCLFCFGLTWALISVLGPKKPNAHRVR